jgi:RHS repeat-associated protein
MNVFKEYGENAQPLAQYYYADGQVLAKKMFGLHGRKSDSYLGNLQTKGGLLYYQQDALGNVMDVTDRTGDIIQSYRYDAFGNLFTQMAASYNTIGFTGKTYDAKASLMDFSARWYSPNVGRFTTADTFSGWMDQPQSLNRYSYVHNNPINFIDPTGRFIQENERICDCEGYVELTPTPSPSPETDGNDDWHWDDTPAFTEAEIRLFRMVNFNSTAINHYIEGGYALASNELIVNKSMQDIYKKASNDINKFLQTTLEGLTATIKVGPYDTFIGGWVIANDARERALDYAKQHNLTVTWDNEADAYRHFIWNAEMTRQIGLEEAAFIATNHEAAFITVIGQYEGVFGNAPVLEIQLSTLMDLWNNKVGRNMANNSVLTSKSTDELFELALKSNALITSPLDQVTKRYGFSKDYVTEDNSVYVVFDKTKGTYEILDWRELDDK